MFGIVRRMAAWGCFAAIAVAQEQGPGAWGSDHVGKTLPEYMTGGECLFCHRYEVGETWQKNVHNLTMTEASPESPAMKAAGSHETLRDVIDEITLLLGGERVQRYLKPNGRYGQVAMHSAMFHAEGDRLEPGAKPGWDDGLFAESCAGCHATAVDSEIVGFAAYAVDCFACHGEVPAAHNTTPELALLAKKNAAGALVETSICAQCHLRGGKSNSTGRPYPNQFVPGDNLLKDYGADFSDEYIAALNPSDAHVYLNVRDVILGGEFEMTCMTCHDVHDQSSRKHRVLKTTEQTHLCVLCHDNPADYKSVIVYEVHSATCQY